MANKLYNEASIQDIANAIREKNKTTNKYKVSQMGNAIRQIKSGESLQEYSQMNPIITKYMNEVTYNPNDYTTSQVVPYIYTETDYTKWYPTSYNVDIEESGILHLADELSVIKKNSIVGANTLENSIPNEVAHWWNTVDGSTTQHGTIKPLGQVRMIKTTANNVRDLGGWACDGGTIKYGKLFRGGFLNESDVDVLVKQCGIRHDLDLRGLSDNGGITSSPLGKEIEYTCTSKYVWYSLENEDDWKTILSKIFEAVAHNEPLIFHCSAGADRTGTVACIIEAILGVSQSNLDKDFELTSFAVYPNARRRTDENWTNLIAEINDIAVGSTFRDKVINWVASLGFTQDEINAFRKSMINGTPSDIVVEEYIIHSITYNLANVTSSNTASQIVNGVSYNATITAKSGYEISSVVVKMNGVDITPSAYANGVITIAKVTGDIVITATATVPKPTYTNLANPTSSDWLVNSRLGSSGVSSETNGSIVTNYIPCKKDDIVYVDALNIGWLKSEANARAHLLNSSKAIIGTIYPFENDDGAFMPEKYDTNHVYNWTYKVGTKGTGTTYETFADNIAYVRFCGSLESTAEAVVITVNEPI